jgi:UPF0755 protein
MRKLASLIIVLLVAAVAAGGWLVMDLRRFLETPLAVGEGLDYSVPAGASLRGVARDLARRGVVDRPRYLLWLARWRAVDDRIKAGEYHVPAGTRPRGLLDLMVSGRVRQYALTLVEGWSFAEVRAAIAEHPQIESTLADADAGAVMAALGHADQHPEGRFFPDTYHFPAGTTDVEFLARAHDTMARVLAAQWADRAEGLPYARPDEALVMASIVEKETGVPQERPAIAGVLVRRLLRDMRLQTDPTVIYGLGEAFDGNLTRAHLRTDNPYNTYTRAGLPPTPICMPGRAAIHAALHPADGDALYFVARGDGSHHFSATLREHNRAVHRFQLGGR